jgi:hypothetical protein
MKNFYPIFTFHRNGKVRHLAIECTTTTTCTQTPLYLPSWCTKAYEDGRPDGYLFENAKTTLDAKVVTDQPDAIGCGIKLNFDGKDYIIEQIETDSKSPCVRVVAVCFKDDEVKEIIRR